MRAHAWLWGCDRYADEACPCRRVARRDGNGAIIHLRPCLAPRQSRPGEDGPLTELSGRHGYRFQSPVRLRVAGEALRTNRLWQASDRADVLRNLGRRPVNM